ncbi:MAG: 2-succinyl-6-hydroxy-2,4-cyclohexadiene-carboxylic acid synthase/2-oxoglutarate decarboxylase [Frankiales bacterium]|nr:2-succinyl-6-hydroxy-2,4-cyclohexadiene-carboxylic acid synthase/2-oxoglutarate decarboxylase [Frankiales bacterium]
MNPATALARTLVDELVRGGVTDAVLAPGSRSAPLAFALHEADASGRLRLHVRIDERSAAFLALGLARESGKAVPVVTTSGTATANLHPAVLEASYGHVPLLVLTADRPPELRGTGSNQTIDQIKLYGGAVRLFVEVGAPELGQGSHWRSLTCRALSAALGDRGAAPGPVHLNLAFREPLVPDSTPAEPGRPDGEAWTTRQRAVHERPVDDLPARTAVVIGDAGARQVQEAYELAAARGFPVVAEPTAGGGPNAVPAAELLLGSGWTNVPDRVLVVGRPTLSRAVGRLVASAPVDVVGAWTGSMAHRVLAEVPCGAGDLDPTWLPSWLEAGRVAQDAGDAQLTGLDEPSVARAVVASAGSLLVVGSSKPVRDLFVAGTKQGLRVLANRGVAGIDGMVSTALGAALAHGRQAFALLGDLTFLHDSNGLIIGPDEPRPDLTIVVVNNDGGAIFGLLEQGAPEHEAAFERVFGTPHGVDLGALCAASGTSYALATSRAELEAALVLRGGVRVVEVRTDRHDAIDVDRRMRAAVQAALRP